MLIRLTLDWTALAAAVSKLNIPNLTKYLENCSRERERERGDGQLPGFLIKEWQSRKRRKKSSSWHCLF